MSAPGPPLGLLAELTHRCPLACPYCSNPLGLARAGDELDTATWLRVLDEAADLGVLQLHLSGGEPLARRDLEAITARARERDIYTNLITSGVLLDEARVRALADAGLEHVQLSIQDADPANADHIGGYHGGHAAKRAAAARVRAAGLPLTVNAVVHRRNLDHLPAIIAAAGAMGADRLEIAHTQYHGWALANRAALMPTRAQVEAADRIVAEAREHWASRMAIDYVTPDYHAHRPKACMGGWGQRFITVAPDGAVLPCHAAAELPGTTRDRVKERPLAAIWKHGADFERFRGTAWMPEPCRSCERREVDFGGCRCQAFALTGDPAATDPVCDLSPHHERIATLAEDEAVHGPVPFTPRRPGNGPAPVTQPEEATP